MRRRSDRKKSTDVQSPAPSRRSTRRLRKSPQPSESDKIETSETHVEKDEECDLKPVHEAKEINEEPLTSKINETEKAIPNNQSESNEDITVLIPEEVSKLSQETEVDNVDPSHEERHEEKVEVNNKADKSDDKTIDEINVKDTIGSETAERIDDQGQDESKKDNEREDEPKEVEHPTENTSKHSSLVKTFNNENVEHIEAISESNSQIDTENEATQKETMPVNTDAVKKAHEVDSVQSVDDGKSSIENEKKSMTNNATIKNAANSASTELTRTKKRKWLTKKPSDAKRPVLSISTNSLKELIADVQPVPLSDVRLESSSDIEEFQSEREEGEESASDDERNRLMNNKNVIKTTALPSTKAKLDVNATPNTEPTAAAVSVSTHPAPRTPSPARNSSSNILYITNLVRPFTVLQLKGLLARTGNIVEDGFWIDRIKSKCYVNFETEDQAIETRHALHGIRWPVSNPKCLNVEFSTKADMDEAVRSTKDDAATLSQDYNKDNIIVGGWSNDHNEVNDKKSNRPVREWDVGKKENFARTNREADVNYGKDRLPVVQNDMEKREKDRRDRRGLRQSSSLSPVRKQKRESDPPLRLLDDLFRKTKATPFIYWLPLTPEQIAEKEAFRQKRIEEHKERMKQREVEVRNRENEKDRFRRERDRERDQKRRSRSRDRRRY